jgi:hypothetical protein
MDPPKRARYGFLHFNHVPGLTNSHFLVERYVVEGDR